MIKKLLVIVLSVLINTLIVNAKQIENGLNTKNLKVKKISVKRLKRFAVPLNIYGLSGKNKQKNYWEAFRKQLPKKYAKSEADIMDRKKNGWVVFNRKSNIAGYLNEQKKVFWKINLGSIVREKNFLVHDLRYENNILYFNAACLSYAKEQKGKCSTLYAYDTAKKRVLWRSKYLTSNNIFIVTDNLIIAGYGFTAEPDYLYILRKIDGKVLKKIKLDSAPEYFEMKGNKLHIITYNNHYIFKLNIW